MAVPLRKRLRRGARSLALRAAAALLGLLPLRAALAVGALVGWVAWCLAGGTRRLALEHLALAFPERSEAERRAIARASLVHLGQVALETIALHRYRDRLEVYVSIAPGGEELVRRAMARGKGLVFVASHIGNWELLAQRLSRVAQPNAVVAKRNADPWLNGAIERLRAEGGLETLWREDPSTGRKLLRLFKRGGGLGILIDQDTKVQGVFVPFFGQLAYTPRAAAELALRFGAAALVVTSHRRGPRPGDGHELEVTELVYDPDSPDPEAEVVRLTAAAVALHESAIRRHPAEWVWMHRRWKTRPPAEGSLAKGMPKSRELSGT
jgi:Kdo2-lipid IVA lauroyltransferase/acyltransferase